jgi:hypothetical protein
MKKPLTLDRIFIEEPTKSILNLLYEYPKGLRPIHIRYALEKNFNEKSNNDDEFLYNVNRAKELFGNRLSQLEQRDLIKKGCIKGREHLHYYLNILTGLKQKRLDVVQKTGYSKSATYKLKKGFFRELFRFRCNQAIYLYPSDSIQELREKRNELFRHYLFGLPTSWYINFNKHDKKLIETNLNEINTRLSEIQIIKFNFVYNETEKRMEKFYQSTTSDNIKNLLRESPQIFFTCLMELSGFEKIHNTYIADIWTDLSYLYNFKNGLPENSMFKLFASWIDAQNKFNQDEINELKEWEQNNRDLLEKIYPMFVSYFWNYFGDIKFYHS